MTLLLILNNFFTKSNYLFEYFSSNYTVFFKFKIISSAARQKIICFLFKTQNRLSLNYNRHF